MATEKKQKVVSSLPTRKPVQTDTGSSQVQVEIFTRRIKELTKHLQANKKDFAARRGLLQLVGKRKRLLKYIADRDTKAYTELIGRLGIRR